MLWNTVVRTLQDLSLNNVKPTMDCLIYHGTKMSELHYTVQAGEWSPCLFVRGIKQIHQFNPLSSPLFVFRSIILGLPGKQNKIKRGCSMEVPCS